MEGGLRECSPLRGCFAVLGLWGVRLEFGDRVRRIVLGVPVCGFCAWWGDLCRFEVGRPEPRGVRFA